MTDIEPKDKQTACLMAAFLICSDLLQFLETTPMHNEVRHRAWSVLRDNGYDINMGDATKAFDMLKEER